MFFLCYYKAILFQIRILFVNFRTPDRGSTCLNDRSKTLETLPAMHHTFPRSKKDIVKDANKISVENDSSEKANQDETSVQTLLSQSCPNITQSTYPAHVIQKPIMGAQILPRLLRGRDKMLPTTPIPAPRPSLLR